MICRDHEIKRATVYAVIDSERAYQDRMWPVGETGLTVGESIVLLQQYVTQAVEQWTSQVGDQAALHQIRKVAAIAVRCMENHGAPYRTGAEIARLTTVVREVRPVFDWPPPKEVAQVYVENKRLMADLAEVRAALERLLSVREWYEGNLEGVTDEVDHIVKYALSRLGTREALAAVREAQRVLKIGFMACTENDEVRESLKDAADRLRTVFGEVER